MNKKTSIIITVIAMLLILLGCIGVYFLVTKSDVDNSSNDIANYEKNEDEIILNEPIFTLENYPKVDASLATQPLTNAFIKNFTGQDVNEEELDYTNTHPGYVRLINDEVDLIVVTEPSEEELKLAKDKGVELEVIPVVKEGFVFYVNGNNPVESLTLDEIQKIYTGEITNWSQVGGNDEKIRAFQRPENSGSQTGMLSLVMKDLNLMEPPKEDLIASMLEIINVVSSYDNGRNSIGYSYYYYATTMYDEIDANVARGIKLLGVNGIKPTYETIQNGTYPIETAYYIVINKNEPQNSDTRKLVEAMLSTRGQNVAKETGYVPIK